MLCNALLASRGTCCATAGDISIITHTILLNNFNTHTQTHTYMHKYVYLSLDKQFYYFVSDITAQNII